LNVFLEIFGNMNLLRKTLFVTSLAFSVVAAANDVSVIVDMEGVDPAQFNADLQSCQGAGTQVQQRAPQREGVLRNSGRTAAVGAAAGAISGGSGTQGAKTGAAVGVVASTTRNARNRRDAAADAELERDQVVKNCMRGRGYKVLN
jgi:hypothetical protein